MLRRVLAAALVTACAASCAEFKSVDGPAADGGAPLDGGLGGETGSAGGDGAPGSEAGAGATQANGPGRWGALPYGYCCTMDSECRTRNCLTIGGAKICGDVCRTDDACTGGLPGFHCVGGSMFVDGHCEPSSGGAACAPAQSFVHGTKALGECCTATHDGGNARECEGGHCDSFGSSSNPYICTNACTKASDCPGNFICSSTSSGYSICAALDDPLTCR